MSIARVWSGATRAAEADAYLDYLKRTGLRDYAATPGNQGILALRRTEGNRAEFTIISLWRDEAAVREFAGSDVERAIFYPEDDEFLVRRDETVSHHEIVFSRLAWKEGRSLVQRWVRWWARRSAPAPPVLPP